MTRGWTRRGLVAVIAASLMVAGCESGRAEQSRSRLVSCPSAAFAVNAVPVGSERIAVERGRQPNPWGDDSFGTAEPFTVLAHRGRDASDPEAIVVSVTGFVGYEGGLDQAAGTQGPDSGAERFRVNGRPAIYTASQRTADGERTAGSDLFVVRQRDLAVRVQARKATKRQLLDVLQRVQIGRKTSAPKVSDPPSGYATVGSVDAGVVAGLNLDVPEWDLSNDRYRSGPGNPEVHRMKWSRTDRGGITATTFPASTGSLDAIPGYAAFSFADARTTSSRVTVAGRPGVALAVRFTSGFTERAVLTQTRWGNLVMIMAWGRSTPSSHELVAMAASVAPISEAEWPHQVPAP